MRNAIVLCAAGELVLLASAMVAGMPVISTVRAAASRSLNAAITMSIALTAWVFAGLGVNGVVAHLPARTRIESVALRVGDFDFKVAVFVPMVGAAMLVLYVLAPALMAAVRGRRLHDCLRATFSRAAGATGQPGEGQGVVPKR